MDTIMRILVFQHVAVEHPGIFREYWRDNGDAWCTVEFRCLTCWIIPELPPVAIAPRPFM